MKKPESMKLRIKDNNIHTHHRSRVKTKFAESGLTNFAPHEMLELLLFYSIPQADTNPTAHRLINKFGNLKNVFDANIENLLTVDGIGENSALLIKLMPALMNEYSKLVADNSLVITGCDVAIEYTKNLFLGIPHEVFYVICLSPENKIIDRTILSSGTVSSVNVSIRKLTQFCLNNNCGQIIVAHNHPMSEAFPSNDDIVMTKKIFNSSVLNEIDVIDHIIISPTGTFSFAKQKIMQQIKEEVLEINKFKIDKDTFNKCSTSVAKYLTGNL